MCCQLWHYYCTKQGLNGMHIAVICNIFCHIKKRMEKEMETVKCQSAKDDPGNTTERLDSYKKCYMYRALMMIGDFGVNLLYPEDSFRRWTNRARKIAQLGIRTER